MKQSSQIEIEWRSAIPRLADNKLIRDLPYESLSARIPTSKSTIGINFITTTTPFSLIPTSTSLSSSLHSAIYRIRPDTGAILFSRQEWGSLLNHLTDAVPPIFDEQCRQLGKIICQLKDVPKDIPQFSGHFRQSTINQIKAGEQVFLCFGGVLILGHTIDRVVFNAELLEKTAKAYLMAKATGR
ncbi:MAG: class II aldolase/adducin family protein, partial [Leptonema sp. (in: Bacteria)]|nr:class II aldolase/adducin family protein [Leptonema sp. (in: bacteria)]